jgi:hypothetical protein
MYCRFESRDGWGLFQQAWTFRDRLDEVPRRAAREFEDAFRWLRCQTPQPPGDVYDDSRSRFPKTWFKSEAKDHVQHAWLLADLMSRHGLRIRHRFSHNPGVIIFEDAVQVVVRPNREHVRIARKPDRQPRWNGDRSTIRRWKSQT